MALLGHMLQSIAGLAPLVLSRLLESIASVSHSYPSEELEGHSVIALMHRPWENFHRGRTKYEDENSKGIGGAGDGAG